MLVPNKRTEQLCVTVKQHFSQAILRRGSGHAGAWLNAILRLVSMMVPAFRLIWTKAILRPVSMMVPDFTLIAEIMMFSEGFSSAKILAKKMIAIMELSQQQLSKQ
eukprot:scaffold14355_cov20-Tisochrysis_lutea.AAC.1